MEYFEAEKWCEYSKHILSGDPTNITNKVYELMGKIIRMLKYLESKQILHNDFGRGENVLINDDRIVIIDFGMNVSSDSLSDNYKFFDDMFGCFIRNAIELGFTINDGCESLTNEKVPNFLKHKYATLISETQ